MIGNQALSAAICGCKRPQCIHSFQPSVGVSGIANAMAMLVFEAVEPALCQPVIPAILFATHRADHAIFLGFVLIRMAGVLAAPIGVMHQSHSRPPAEPSHRQRISHDIRRHVRLQRPANNFTVK